MEHLFRMCKPRIKRTTARRGVARRRPRRHKIHIQQPYLLLAQRLLLGSMLRRQSSRPTHKVLTGEYALVLLRNLLCRMGPVLWGPKGRRKDTLIKSGSALACGWNRLKCFVWSWSGRSRTSTCGSRFNHGPHSELSGVTPS